ncbi:hypothetical protein G9A89_000952 [Geosiphon pyriformis]|nr:hypothetical protein G9A89_000952 [Geosiphon pyriformis]
MGLSSNTHKSKDQWASSSTVQIPFEIKGFERFKGVRVNEKLMKDLNLMFPALKKEILNYLRQTKIIVRDLVFVGHGLGGAYASIAGVKWAFESYLAKINNLWKGVDLSKIGQVVITFGAPRVGNRKFSELANESITHNRITFGNDPAQHFPLASEVWKHYGIETWIQPLKECDCIVDMNPLSHKYWNCNNNELEHLDRERWINGDYTEENMVSGEDVPGDFFHDGPYFGVKMGDCENLKAAVNDALCKEICQYSKNYYGTKHDDIVAYFNHKYPKLHISLEQVTAATIKFNDQLIKEKGKNFAKLLGMHENEMQFSNGWIQKFKKRNQLRVYRFHDEAGSVSTKSLPEE